MQKEYLLRAVRVSKKGIKKVIKEKRCTEYPSDFVIADFLDRTNCDFVSCIENYRLIEPSEYSDEEQQYI